MEYNVDDIFIEREDGDFDMIIPPEIAEKMGLVFGDKLKLELGDKGTIIITKIEDAD